MATVNKNFVVKNGLVVQGSTATVNGNNILTENNGDTYILNLVGGATLVKSVDNTVFTVDNTGYLTINSGVFDSYGSASAAQSAAEEYADNAASAAYDNAVADSNSYTNSAISGEVTNRNSAIATAKGEAISDASADATSKANAAQAAAELTASNALSSAVADLEGQISDAETNANTYTNNAITNLNLSGTYDALGAASTALQDAKDYTDQEVAALVDSAPALLDTLNELAAAIADNPNYASDVANLVATKADTSYVNSEISDLDSAAQGYANAAQSAAEATASADATAKANAAQSAAESYADGIVSTLSSNTSSDITDAISTANGYTDTAIASGDSTATPTYAGINFGWVAKDFANYQWIENDSQTTVATWPLNYATAKLTVHLRNGVHSQASEVLIARDSSNNIHITEYAIVTTNGILGDVTAIVLGSDILLKVTPTHSTGTDVAVRGSALIWAD